MNRQKLQVRRLRVLAYLEKDELQNKTHLEAARKLSEEKIVFTKDELRDWNHLSQDEMRKAIMNSRQRELEYRKVEVHRIRMEIVALKKALGISRIPTQEVA